jgi:hypothetical protein
MEQVSWLKIRGHWDKQKALTRRLAKAFDQRSWPANLPLWVELQGQEIKWRGWSGHHLTTHVHPAPPSSFFFMTTVTFSKDKLILSNEDPWMLENNSATGDKQALWILDRSTKDDAEEGELFWMQDIENRKYTSYNVKVSLESLLTCLRLFHDTFLPVFCGHAGLLNIMVDYLQGPFEKATRNEVLSPVSPVTLWDDLEI